MRYDLKYLDASRTVEVKKGGQPDEFELSFGDEQAEVSSRTFRYHNGLLQEPQQDGSLKNLRFAGGKTSPQSVSFFFDGRVRELRRVGGLGGSVEGTQSEGAVVAPMNGQVVKTLHQVGESVSSGDIVLILEAMKMENEVTAPISGVLKELSVAGGQTVSPGQPLFLVEASE